MTFPPPALVLPALPAIKSVAPAPGDRNEFTLPALPLPPIGGIAPPSPATLEQLLAQMICVMVFAPDCYQARARNCKDYGPKCATARDAMLGALKCKPGGLGGLL